MGTDVAVVQANLPAHLQGREVEKSKEFSGGVQSGFPVLSYRGKVWRVKVSGDEKVYVDDKGNAIQTIEGVLVKSNPTLAKTHYEGKYKEGDSGKPRCWSSTGEKPDPDVPNPLNVTCAACPMNIWGSRTSDEGKKMKACQDVRRATFIFRHELEAITRGEKTMDEALVMLLRVPPASLNPLKEYAERIESMGAAPYYLFTTVGFDTDASFPKLSFKGSQWLDETEFGAVEGLRDSDAVQRILNTSAEHATEGTTGEGSEAASSETSANVEASKPAPSEASAVQQEEAYSQSVDDGVAPEAPAAPAAPAPQTEIAPPARPAAVEEAAATPAQPPAPTPVPQAEAQPSVPSEPAAPSPSGSDGDIDEMLSSILD